MKIIKGLCICLIASVLVLSACGPAKNIDDSLTNIPNDITSVTAFNTKQLLQKADLNYIQSLEFYKATIQELKQKNPALASILEQPTNSGVDLKRNFYFIVDVAPDNPKDKFYGFVFSIADQSMFETMLTQTKVGSFQKEDQFNFVIRHNNLLAWNETFAVIGSGDRSFDVKKEMNRFFGVQPEQSIASNSDLKKCLSENYDIATWINSNFLSKNRDIKKSAAIVGISKEALEGNYVHAYLNFNQGNITGNSKHFLQKELMNDLKLFFKDGIDQNVSKYIPADNLGLLIGGALDTKGIYQIISEKVGGYTMANKGLKKFGFTIKDIANAFGGDVVLGLYDHSNGIDAAESLMVSNINDPIIFDKFIDLAKQFDIIEKQEENLYLIKDLAANLMISKSNEAAYLLVKDDLFFVSVNKSIIQTIKEGGYRSANRVNSSTYSLVSTNAIGAYIDFEKYKRLFDRMEKDHKFFTNLELEAKVKQANIKIELADKNRNSLKALFELMNEIYLSEQNEPNRQTI